MNHFENKKTMKKKGVGTWWCDEELIEVDEEGPAVRQHRRRPRPAVPRRQQPLEEVACYYFNHRARARAEGRKLSRHGRGGVVELIGSSLIVLAGGGDFLWGVVLVALLVLETTCNACVCEQQGKKVVGEWWVVVVVVG